jgi:type IV secretion system protein VirB4
MLSLREHRPPTNRLPDLLPWAALIAPGVVLQKDAVLQQTIAFRGPDLASSNRPELVSAVARVNNALRRLGSGWAMFVEAQRNEVTSYPPSRWSSPAAWIVDVERRDHLQRAGARFESSYYLTFTWRLPADHQQRAVALFYDDPRQTDVNERFQRDLAHFLKAVNEVVDIMSGVFTEVRVLDDDETLTYLHSTVSIHRHVMHRPEVPMYLDGLLTDMAFTSGDVPMLGDHYIPTCTVNGFPATTVPGILDQLNHLGFAYRWVTRFLFLDKQDSRAELERYRRGWFQQRKSLLTLVREEAIKQESALVNNAAALKASDADAALQVLGEDLAGFGYLTTTVTVWDREYETACRKLQVVKQVIQSNGFSVVDETLNAREAWLGSLPGHTTPNVRRPIVSTLNVAHVMPVSATWAGDAENRHLLEQAGVGTPHVYCSTAGSTPFRLHLAVGDVGHTLVIGPTGAGKSTLLALLALQWLRYPGAQVLLFDKDRSARAATLAVGGTLYEPGDDHASAAFQPLGRIDDRTERLWAEQFVLSLLAAQHVRESPEIKARIDDALRSLASAPRRQRTLSVLTGMLPPALGTALRPYTLSGSFGQIFDGDHNDIVASSWQMFEMGHLMALGAQAVVPALEYLFHRAEERFTGRPTLLILDEAWLFLRHPVFAGRLQAWLKTLRKKNVYAVLATQDIADAISSPIIDTILSACPTKIYLPNDEALTPQMASAYAKFGLTGTELELLAQAQKKRDYYYRSVNGRRVFSLDLGPVALAFAGMSAPDDQRTLDDIVRTVEPEQRAEAILRARALDWAADRIATARASREPLVS